jgi:16S rRNA (cytosine1402-N4)-methyltransferase
MNDASSSLNPAEEAGPRHVPVLLAESMAALQVRPGGRYLDVTLGLGGHTEAILDRCAPDGRVTAMDRDPAALALARRRLDRFGDRLVLINDNFSNVGARGFPLGSFDGVLADLGVSSLQLDSPERGFSFLRGGPLDMRMGIEGETALEYLRRVSAEELEERLRDAGEERFARRLARNLRSGAPRWSTTMDVAEAVAHSIPRRGHGHPATRVFLALRMAVNLEMESLRAFLSTIPGLLSNGGRLVVLTFHSTEDRVVKRFYRAGGPGEGRLTPVGKKPWVPGEEEQARNPRSRSAKMRVFEAP